VSAARPKVAEYPFTTLHPSLGVVSVEAHRSFVMADIPGLIEGAAEGAGLGIRFLKHLSRTRLLLHVIDIAPVGDDRDALAEARSITKELESYSPELAGRERWLVINKTDLLSAEEGAARTATLTRGLDWSGPVYQISALTGAGTKELMRAVLMRIEELDRAAAEPTI